MNAGQTIGFIDGQQVVGLDIAKNVFQLHTVDMEELTSRVVYKQFDGGRFQAAIFC